MDGQGVFANSVVGDFASQHPRTLKDAYEEEKPGILERLTGFIALPVGWAVGGTLGDFMRLDQISDNLPEPPDSFRHVYLVSVPHEGWPISFSHWSVFSQGRFYHLSVPNLESGLKYQSGSGIEKSENVVLKVEDPYAQDPDDAKRKPPLAIYEVGSTDYLPQELQMIAEWVIRQMSTYDLFKNNCQVFALSMIYRTVMTKRDCSVFVGTKQQIADWDAKDVSDRAAHASSMQNGFLVQAPNSIHIPKIVRFLSLEGFTNNVQQHKQAARAIKILYEQGPLAPGGHDPSGKLGPWKYAWSKFSSDMKESWEMLSRASKETGQDIANGRLKSALMGRDNTRREMFLKAQQQMDDGMIFGKAWLYFHAFVLYGSIGKARRMTADEPFEGGMESNGDVNQDMDWVGSESPHLNIEAVGVV